jgi:hypothetical protein
VARLVSFAALFLPLFSSEEAPSGAAAHAPLLKCCS